jgi:uncharacterized repeat protein (TIGR03803 family)
LLRPPFAFVAYSRPLYHRRIPLTRLSARAYAVCLFLAATAVASSPRTFKRLANFDGTNGNNPLYISPVQGIDGNLYGTTYSGGANVVGGTVFKVTPEGKLSAIHSFCSQTNCPDGAQPFAGLVQASDGNLYGTTSVGGIGQSCPVQGGCGTIFKITPSGKLTTLYSFCAQANCADGSNPVSTVVQATDGDFYGTTVAGGNSQCLANGCGTVFKISRAGKFTTLYEFCSQTNCADGANPYAGLIQGSDSNLYGASQFGGINGGGTVFKITSKGTLTTLYSFCAQTNCTDGAYPQGTLAQATDGVLYGTTYNGGDNGTACQYGCGTLFKVTLQGALTTLYSFCAQMNCADGANPSAELVQATDGNFYGTTVFGGKGQSFCEVNPPGCGTVFRSTPAGALTTLHSFCNGPYCPDGAALYGGVVQATDAKFYGTTSYGGAHDGTVFSLSIGLRAFVETLPTLGKVGSKVIILGTNLTGATGVSFNGTAAKFIVVSKSEIKTTVPVGATTGKVKVKTPQGSLVSNVNFRVVK